MTSEVELTSVRSQTSMSHEQAFPTFYRREARKSVTCSSHNDQKGLTINPRDISLDDDGRVEYPPMPEEKKLGIFSTASLIISKMIGTGVFAKPAYVLLNSGGKSIALALWLGGGVMTLCG